MDLRKIIREEIDDLQWIHDIKPRDPNKISVGDYYYIIDNGLGQNMEKSKATHVRYILKVLDIYDDGTNNMVIFYTMDKNSLRRGVERFYIYEEDGESVSEDDLPYREDYQLYYDEYLTYNDAKQLVDGNYWRYTENPLSTLLEIEG